MKYILSISFYALLLILSNGLHASTIYTECGSCNSYEKEIIAKQVSSGQAGSVHDVLLMNTETFSLSKLRVVSIQPNEPGVPATTHLYNVQLSSDELQFRNQVQDYYNWSMALEVPPGVLESAWQLSGDVTKQTQLINWARENESFISRWTGYLNRMLEIADLIDEINAGLQLYTVDGDVILLDLEYIGNDFLLSYSLDSAWDLVSIENQSYNNIPWTRDEWGRDGVYKIRDAEYDMFTEAATRLNMSVQISGSGSGTNGGIVLECRPPDTGYGVVCKRL